MTEHRRTADPIWLILNLHGQSLRWLARRMGYSEFYVSRIASGHRAVTSEFVARAALALDLPPEALFLSVRSTDGQFLENAGASA